MLNSINATNEAKKRRHTSLDNEPNTPGRRTRRPRKSEPLPTARSTRSTRSNQVIRQYNRDGSSPLFVPSRPQPNPQAPEEDEAEVEDPNEDEDEAEDRGRVEDEGSDEDNNEAASEADEVRDSMPNENSSPNSQLPPTSGQQQPKANEPEVVILGTTRHRASETERSSSFRSARSSIRESPSGQRSSPDQVTYFDRSRQIMHGQNGPFGDDPMAPGESRSRRTPGPRAAEQMQQLSANVDAWVNETIAGTAREEDWRYIHNKGKDLLRFRAAKESRPEPTEYTKEYIDYLCDLYKQLARPGEINSTSISQRRQECRDLRVSIQAEAFEIFKQVIEEAHQSKAPKVNLVEFVNQFETHIVPSMVACAIRCFQAYTVGGLEQEELDDMLNLLCKVCFRISELWKSEILWKHNRRNIRGLSRKLVAPVKRIMKALDDGQLHQVVETSVAREGDVALNSFKILPSQEPWADKEWMALVDTLNRLTLEGVTGEFPKLCILLSLRQP